MAIFIADWESAKQKVANTQVETGNPFDVLGKALFRTAIDANSAFGARIIDISALRAAKSIRIKATSVDAANAQNPKTETFGDFGSKESGIPLFAEACGV